VERTRSAVTRRLTQQINFLHAEATRIKQAQESGSGTAPKTPPARLRARAESLEQRMQERRAQLDAQGRLTVRPPEIIGAAVLLPASAGAPAAPPAGAGDGADGAESSGAEPAGAESAGAESPGTGSPRAAGLTPVGDERPPRHAVDTVTSDRRAVALVLAAERALGRVPEEMPHNNPGFDIRSTTADG